MITLREAMAQVRRLRHLENYPAEEGSELELVKAAANALNLEHCRRSIDEILQTAVECPKPATMRNLVRPIQAWQVQKERLSCPRGRCDGSGWSYVYTLKTEESRAEYNYTRSEKLTYEQYQDLGEKIDHKTQRIYSAVEPCPCRGQAVARRAPEKANGL
jgi:hypothetical protein